MLKELEEVLKQNDCTIDQVIAKYAEVRDVGNAAPEAVIEKELPKEKDPFNGMRTSRLIEPRGHLKKYTAEWRALSKRRDKSCRADRRRAPRRGIGVAEWK